MRIFQNAFEAGKSCPGAVVAIDKFDAVHRGHLKVIGAALTRAKALKTSCVVVTFDPSPEQYLRLYSYKPVLPLAQRLERLRELGVDAVVLLPFDKNLACLSPEAFAKNVLALQLRPVEVCVGEDFCFGKDRAGNIGTLQRLGCEMGFLVSPIALVKSGGEKISASLIRRSLESGDRQAAEKLLGRKLPA
ncbi:MAG: FAD synthetase family protein [Elusimicrobia bacterium]|nr:FAD synthetase family protein [Elusimicrobiota bacterium]